MRIIKIILLIAVLSISSCDKYIGMKEIELLDVYTTEGCVDGCSSKGFHPDIKQQIHIIWKITKVKEDKYKKFLNTTFDDDFNWAYYLRDSVEYENKVEYYKSQIGIVLDLDEYCRSCPTIQYLNGRGKKI